MTWHYHQTEVYLRSLGSVLARHEAFPRPSSFDRSWLNKGAGNLGLSAISDSGG